MFRILIVDDERLIRESIALQLKKSCYASELEEPFMARNGLEAQRVMEQSPIDIVFLDIKMPVMDGLALLHWGREKFPQTQFVMISGFGEFSYVQQAINDGAVGYILKPTPLKELEKAVGTAADRLREMNKVARLEQEKQIYQERISQAQAEHEFNAFFHAASKSALELGPDQHAVLLLLQSVHTDWEGKDIFGEQLSFQKQVLRCCSEIFGGEAIAVRDITNETGIMVLMTGALEMQTIRRRAAALYECCSREQLQVVIGVSVLADRLAADLYPGALRALDARILGSQTSIFYALELSDREPVVRREELVAMAQLVELHDRNGAQTALKEMLRKDRYDQSTAWQVFPLLGRLLSAVRHANGNLFRIPAEDDIRGCVSDWKDVESFFDSVVGQLLGKEDTNDQNACMLREITDYVDRHYAQNMSIRDWANRYYLNHNYLAALFKGATGRTFGQYITERRIEKACVLLTSSDASIQQIAAQVGFEDVSYFHRVFKKAMGVPPREYQLKKT